jgi:hypothetical protein
MAIELGFDMLGGVPAITARLYIRLPHGCCARGLQTAGVFIRLRSSRLRCNPDNILYQGSLRETLREHSQEIMVARNSRLDSKGRLSYSLRCGSSRYKPVLSFDCVDTSPSGFEAGDLKRLPLRANQ